MILQQGSDYPRENLLISFLRAIGFFLFYHAVRSVVYNAATIFLTIKYREPSAIEAAFYKSANTLSFVCGIIIILSLVFFFKVKGERVREAMHVGKPSASVVALAFFIGVSLNFSTNVLLSLLPEGLIESYVDTASNAQESSILWYVLAAVIMAPVVEELIFRAMMLPRFSTSVGNIWAIVITAAIFGAIHDHIVWSSYAFLLGLILGFVFVRSRSLLVNIALHLGYNLVSLTSYISLDSLDYIESALANFALTVISVSSIPISAALIFFFFEKTRDTGSKMPIGLSENSEHGGL